MMIEISGWFNEMGLRIEVSHKVFKLIDELLNERLTDLSIYQKKPDFTIDLVLTTGEKSMNELLVWGHFTKKKTHQYILWMPYNPITKSENYLKTFLYYYFEALKKVFQNYQIASERLDEIREIVEKETVDNPEYVYIDPVPHDKIWVQKILQERNKQVS